MLLSGGEEGGGTTRCLLNAMPPLTTQRAWGIVTWLKHQTIYGRFGSGARHEISEPLPPNASIKAASWLARIDLQGRAKRRRNAVAGSTGGDAKESAADATHIGVIPMAISLDSIQIGRCYLSAGRAIVCSSSWL